MSEMSIKELFTLVGNRVTPIDKGGTGATTAAQARTNLGLRTETARTEIRELLWENASPSSPFSNQTISLDLNPYNTVEIEFLESAISNRDKHYFQRIKKDERCVFNILSTTTYASASVYTSQLVRNVTAQSNSISFEKGYYRTLTSTSAFKEASDVCVPLKIWGIKEV